MPSWMVGVSASVILPCTIKFRGRFLLATAYPGSPGKSAIKRLCVCMLQILYMGLVLSMFEVYYDDDDNDGNNYDNNNIIITMIILPSVL